MEFLISVTDDESAQLIDEYGEVLWTFRTLESARRACRDWYATPEIPATKQLTLPTDTTTVH